MIRRPPRSTLFPSTPLFRSFDVVQTATPLVKAQLLQRYSLRSLARQRRAAMAQWLELADDAPHTLRLVMQRLRSGRLQADLDIRHIDRLSLALEIGRAHV